MSEDLYSLLFSYQGRIGRSKFWLGTLCVVLAVVVIGAATRLAATALGQPGQPSAWSFIVVPLGLAWYVAVIAAVYAQFSVSVKRYHDRGKSAWWMLLALVPLGGLWLLFEAGALPGDPGTNAYGPPVVPT